MRTYWRGSVEAWECDEMGHMNVRYWIRHGLDGVLMLADDIGCAGAFGRAATATLVPKSQHIKFMREARAGAPLFSRGGIVSVRETELIYYCEIVHTMTGEIGATFRTTLVHVDAKTGKPFAFPQRVAALSQAYRVDVPAHGQPRSIALAHEPDLTLMPQVVASTRAHILYKDDKADKSLPAMASGYRFLGLSGVRGEDVDLFDRLYPEGMMARVSNAMPNFLSQWRHDAMAELAEKDGIARIAGAAVLEYRLDYLAWPSCGDLTAVYSGIIGVTDKAITLRHWIMDPLSGAPWCVCEALAVTLDLEARKIIPNPPRAKAALEAMLVTQPQ
jgi:acyl-CoA thioester hydrolase